MPNALPSSGWSRRSPATCRCRSRSSRSPAPRPAEITDGAALWTKPKSEITPADYTDFYRSIAGQFDEPALTIHFRAEGRQDYTALFFVPGSRPFDLFDPDRTGRIKLYVKRVFITDDAEILPRYLRFVRGLVDSADLPLNVSREKIQESPLLAAIRKGATSRVLSELERLADKEPETYTKIWDTFRRGAQGGHLRGFRAPRRAAGAGALQDHGVRRTTWRSLKDYVARAARPNQTAIYYLAGDDIERLKSSPHLEGFRARGIEVLLLPDPVDTFWVMPGLGFDGKPFKSVTQGAADLALIPLLDAAGSGRRRCRRLGQGFPGVHEGDARRRRGGCASIGSAHRQRGVSGRAAIAARTGRWNSSWPARGGSTPRRSRSWRSIRGIELVVALRGTRRGDRGPSRRMRRICCSTRRGCSTAIGRPMRRSFSERLARVLEKSAG